MAKTKYIHLFESEYWQKVKQLADLGLGSDDVYRIEQWLDKRAKGAEVELGPAMEFDGLGLKTLPPGDWQSRGYATFTGSALESLPDGFSTGNSLFLKDMPNLKRLPDGLKVGEHLIIARCPELESLPNGLKVKNDLTVMDTPLRSLPGDMEVGSKITLIDTFIPREEAKELKRQREPLGKDGDVFFMGHEGPVEGPRTG